MRILRRSPIRVSTISAGVRSGHVLDVWGHPHPGVHAILIDGKGWAWEGGLGECADRDRNGARGTFECVVDRCATGRAEVEHDPTSLIADACVLLRYAADAH